MAKVVINFDEIFSKYVATNQKQWEHNRSLTVGASEVFSCIRKAFFDKRGAELGFTPDDDYVEDWGAASRGNLIENYHVVPAIRDHMPANLKVLYTGDDQKTLVLDKTSATPDGLITGLPKNCSVQIIGGTQDITIDNIESDCIVLELKSIDPRATLVEERRKHNGQTHMQLGLFRENTPHKPVYSIVLYIDASFLSKVTPFVVKFDPELYQHGKERARAVWETDDPVSLIPEGIFDDGCKFCKWRRACGSTTANGIPKYDDESEDATPETIAKLDVLVKEHKAAADAAIAAEKTAQYAKEAIKSFLLTTNRRKIQGPEWTVTWYSQSGKTSYDTKAMEKAGIDLSPFEKTGAEFDVLRVTPRLAKNKKKA